MSFFERMFPEKLDKETSLNDKELVDIVNQKINRLRELFLSGSVKLNKRYRSEKFPQDLCGPASRKLAAEIGHGAKVIGVSIIHEFDSLRHVVVAIPGSKGNYVADITRDQYFPGEDKFLFPAFSPETFFYQNGHFLESDKEEFIKKTKEATEIFQQSKDFQKVKKFLRNNGIFYLEETQNNDNEGYAKLNAIIIPPPHKIKGLGPLRIGIQ